VSANGARPAREETKFGSAKGSGRKLHALQDSNGGWRLVHPRCAQARQQDIEEVEQMIAAGENEIARDELRWLLAECHDFIVAHKLLGDLAAAGNDIRLARGHYGYAYQLGMRAIDAAGGVRRLSYSEPANRAFFEAGKGLVSCLLKQGKAGMAREVIDRLLGLDAGDPLRLRAVRTGGGGGAKGKRRGK